MGIRQLLLAARARRRPSMPCVACGHPLRRHRRESALNTVDAVMTCRYCDCVVRVPLPVAGRLHADGPATTSAVPGVDLKGDLGLIARRGNAPNDAADPALYLRVDTNTNALHGGVGQACAVCSQTIQAGQAVRKHVDGTYVHDVCPARSDPAG